MCDDQIVQSNLLLSMALATVISIRAADGNERWSVLKRITTKRSYAFTLNDATCIMGEPISVNDDSITIRPDNAQQKVIQRSQILRVTDHSDANSHDTVFSNRSSWQGVMDAKPTDSEQLLILTKQGQRFRWRKPSVSAYAISQNDKTIDTAAIRSVAYLRFTPLTASEAYFEHEDVGFLAPRLWFNAGLLPKIAVPLYDSTLVEDNSPLECKIVWRPQRDSNPR